MTFLIGLRDKIRNFYQKNRVFLRPLGKAVLSFIILFYLSRMFGYNSRINQVYFFAVLSFMQAFLPISFLFYVSTALIALNLLVVSPEIMLIFLAVAAACWLVFVHLDRSYGLLMILTPVLFYLQIEYLMPVLVGMIFGVGGILPVMGGILIYYIAIYTRDVSTLLASTAGNNETGLALQRMIQLFTTNRELFVMLTAFCLVIFISAVLYRMFHERAWQFAVIIGNVTLAFILLSGRLIFELDLTVWRVFLECVLAVFLAGIYQLFRGLGDVSRIEKVTFEDDEYIYYVKAVPKVQLSLGERNVTRIQPEEEPKDAVHEGETEGFDDVEDAGGMTELDHAEEPAPDFVEEGINDHRTTAENN